jgi:hypothetical protein
MVRPYGTAADVWAVGVLAYEMLTSRAPFHHRCPKMAALLTQAGRYMPLPPGVSAECASFVGAAMTLQAGARPAAIQLLSHPWIMKHCGQGAAWQPWEAAAAPLPPLPTLPLPLPLPLPPPPQARVPPRRTTLPVPAQPLLGPPGAASGSSGDGNGLQQILTPACTQPVPAVYEAQAALPAPAAPLSAEAIGGGGTLLAAALLQDVGLFPGGKLGQSEADAALFRGTPQGQGPWLLEPKALQQVLARCGRPSLPVLAPHAAAPHGDALLVCTQYGQGQGITVASAAKNGLQSVSAPLRFLPAATGALGEPVGDLSMTPAAPSHDDGDLLMLKLAGVSLLPLDAVTGDETEQGSCPCSSYSSVACSLAPQQAMSPWPGQPLCIQAPRKQEAAVVNQTYARFADSVCCRQQVNEDSRLCAMKSGHCRKTGESQATATFVTKDANSPPLCASSKPHGVPAPAMQQPCSVWGLCTPAAIRHMCHCFARPSTADL